MFNTILRRYVYRCPHARKERQRPNVCQRVDFGEGINLLTGRNAQVLDLGYDLDSDFPQHLQALLKKNAVVTIASSQKILRNPGDLIENLHDYSVLGFDPAGPGGGTLILRDPYGKRSVAGDKPIRVRVDQLRDDFDWIALEDKP